MSTETFNKENLDIILKELSKEYKRLGGKSMPAEIILIGGAAIVERYGFRDMTTDIDAVIVASSVMKDAINNVGDRLNLPSGWLNDDFKRTDSYSVKLQEISKYYRTFSQVLEVRIVTDEYLIAMKLKAGRKYKNDLSDIVGVLKEHKASGDEITFDKIEGAVKTLYSGWESIPNDSISFIKEICENGDYDKLYDAVCDNEKTARETLIEFDGKYPQVANSKNANDIIKILQEKKK